jgi:transposase
MKTKNSKKYTHVSANDQERLLFCNALFDVEREIADLKDRHAATPEEITQIRSDRSIPLLNEFHDWLVMLEPQTLPKSKIGTAVSYAIEQWKYLLDPRLEISNILDERSIRSFCIGKKNHLSSDTQNGAYASATIYSLVQTTKENNLKPYENFKFLLSALLAASAGTFCPAIAEMKCR